MDEKRNSQRIFRAGEQDEALAEYIAAKDDAIEQLRRADGYIVLTASLMPDDDVSFAMTAGSRQVDTLDFLRRAQRQLHRARLAFVEAIREIEDDDV